MGCKTDKMSDISTEELKKEINAILKTADLTVISAKKVREQVETKLNCSLVSRKKEIDSIVMDFIDNQNEGDENDDDASEEEKSEEAGSESEEEPSTDDDEKKKSKKRSPPATRKPAPKKKRKSLNASDSGSESDGGSDSDYEQPKKSAAKKKRGKRGAGSGRKSTGFTRPYNLSPELSALMGAEALPRHEVVKKVWGIIKERNLYDPKNKQYAICDDELSKLMGVKRFRTFAMLKYLKPHFLN